MSTTVISLFKGNTLTQDTVRPDIFPSYIHLCSARCIQKSGMPLTNNTSCVWNQLSHDCFLNYISIPYIFIIYIIYTACVTTECTNILTESWTTLNYFFSMKILLHKARIPSIPSIWTDWGTHKCIPKFLLVIQINSKVLPWIFSGRTKFLTILDLRTSNNKQRIILWLELQFPILRTCFQGIMTTTGEHAT